MSLSPLSLCSPGRLAPSPHAARPPEQGDVPAVPSPGVLPLRPALPHLRRGGLLRHHLGHLLRGDETHLLCARRGDHPAAGSTRKLQRESSRVTLPAPLCSSRVGMQRGMLGCSTIPTLARASQKRAGLFWYLWFLPSCFSYIKDWK